LSFSDCPKSFNGKPQATTQSSRNAVACGLPLNEVKSLLRRMTMAICEDSVREELKKVIDPELFVNIVDLGLIYEVTIDDAEEADKKNIKIDMTLTSPMCPAGPQLIAQSKQVVEAIEDVDGVEVKIVLDPAWSPDRMTDDARDQLGIF
jgi:metal-sulfur cluster biosynthetic enzyme